MSPDLSLLKEKTLENLLNMDDADESGDFSNRDKLKHENIKEKTKNFEINYQIFKFILI